MAPLLQRSAAPSLLWYIQISIPLFSARLQWQTCACDFGSLCTFVFAPGYSYLLLLSFFLLFPPISEVAIYGIHQPVNLVQFFNGVFHKVAKAPKVSQLRLYFKTTGRVTSESLMLPFFPIFSALATQISRSQLRLATPFFFATWFFLRLKNCSRPAKKTEDTVVAVEDLAKEGHFLFNLFYRSQVGCCIPLQSLLLYTHEICLELAQNGDSVC
jgi:hypothetical protein